MKMKHLFLFTLLVTLTGSYKEQAKATSNFGTTPELFSFERKFAPPTFMEPSEDIIAWEGETVSIIATVGGNPFPTIKVYGDGVELKNTERIKLNIINDKLYVTIENVKMEDAGVYTIEATNKFGTTEASLWLIVLDPT